MNILVTGANGFVGRALIPRLLREGHRVLALVRNKRRAQPFPDGVELLEGDLLLPEALPQLPAIDRAFYLVHGLKAQAESFEHLEALAAVNCINWVRSSGASFIYLGGLGPRNETLSAHLRSRMLTGALLGSSGLGAVELRASIILGDGSLSFEMIKSLVERLPLRPELPLLGQLCQPLAVDDLIDYLIGSLALEGTGHRIIEIGGPEQVTYGELLDLYARLSGKVRPKLRLPEVDARVLMKALDYSIPEHAQMGKKMTESLAHPTVVTDDSAAKHFPGIQPMGLEESMRRAMESSKTSYAPLWDKEFLASVLGDKVLSQSGLVSPELVRRLEQVNGLTRRLRRK